MTCINLWKECSFVLILECKTEVTHFLDIKNKFVNFVICFYLFCLYYCFFYDGIFLRNVIDYLLVKKCVLYVENRLDCWCRGTVCKVIAFQQCSVLFEGLELQFLVRKVGGDIEMDERSWCILLVIVWCV